MSENREVTVSFGGLWFVLFIAIKLAGTSLAAWSWWWIFLPIIPILALVVQKMGL